MHYGLEVAAVPVGNHVKLMGEDVIIAHRLLKNNITPDEYILLSQSLIDLYGEQNIVRKFEWGELHDGHISVKHLGTMNFGYFELTPPEN